MTEASRFSAGDFLFNAPLYTAYTVTPADLTQLLELPVDGYCPYCHKLYTFTSPATDAAARARLANALRGAVVGNGNFFRVPDILCRQDKLTITCARTESHSVQFVFRLENMELQKIGQFPSLADIAIDESKTYRTVLTPEDSSEFHKAIGLAAHGVGIGSFVICAGYLSDWSLVALRNSRHLKVGQMMISRSAWRSAWRFSTHIFHPFSSRTPGYTQFLAWACTSLTKNSASVFSMSSKPPLSAFWMRTKKRKRNCSCATP